MRAINHAMTKTLTARLAAGGVTLPKALAAEIDRLATLYRHPGPERVDAALTTAVATAYLEGRDPADDKAVRDLVTRNALAGMAGSWTYTLTTWADDRIGTAFADAFETLMAECAAAITKAGTALATTTAHLSPLAPLGEQAEAALRGGTTTADAWRTATTAVATIDAAADAQGLLIHTVLGRSYHAPLLALLLRDHTVPRTTRDVVIAGAYSTNTWRLAAEHALTITGATVTELEAGMERLNDERDTAIADQAHYDQQAAAKVFRFR